MITATLQEAKAKLNALIESARTGEDVVLLRGSEIVARISPLSASDLEIAPQLTSKQAEKFWDEVHDDETTSFGSIEEAARSLKKKSRKS